MLSQLDTEVDVLQAILDSLGEPAKELGLHALSAAELCELLTMQSAEILPIELLESLSGADTTPRTGVR